MNNDWGFGLFLELLPVAIIGVLLLLILIGALLQ